MKRLTLGWPVVLLVLVPVLAAAQTAGQAPAPAAAAGAAAPPAYSYNPEGRRDPFVSLLRRGTEVGRTQGQPVEGVAGMIVNDLILKGIMQSRGQFVALVQGPDNKTYLVRVNDRLLDGAVRTITADTMILMQDVNDPLSPTKQREVRKSLRAAVEHK